MSGFISGGPYGPKFELFQKIIEYVCLMKKILLILLCIFTFFACQKDQQKTIILSKASSNYVKWIEDKNVIILDAGFIGNQTVWKVIKIEKNKEPHYTKEYE